MQLIKPTFLSLLFLGVIGAVMFTYQKQIEKLEGNYSHAGHWYAEIVYRYSQSDKYTEKVILGAEQALENGRLPKQLSANYDNLYQSIDSTLNIERFGAFFDEGRRLQLSGYLSITGDISFTSGFNRKDIQSLLATSQALLPQLSEMQRTINSKAALINKTFNQDFSEHMSETIWFARAVLAFLFLLFLLSLYFYLRSEKTEKLLALADENRLRSIGQISAGLAHTMTDLLLVVRISLDNLNQRIASPDSDFDLAREVTNRMRQINKSMMNYCSDGDFDLRQFNVSNAVERAIKNAGNTRTITIDDSTNGQTMAYGSPAFIEVVFQNLLKNIEQTPGYDKPVAIKISKGRDFVEVSFTDQGGGIQVTPIDAIFEPFYSSHQQTNSGLGLSAAKEVLSQCGGWISAKNVEGGACFTVFLRKKGRNI